jgi:hypothetical protein
MADEGASAASLQVFKKRRCPSSTCKPTTSTTDAQSEGASAASLEGEVKGNGG